MFGQVVDGFTQTFWGPRRARAVQVFLGAGIVTSGFYLVMLPSPAVGGFSLAALHYLTPSLTVLAILLGFGLSAALAINITAVKRSASSGTVGFAGIVSSILPGSLCCTSVVPSVLALAGASGVSIIGSTGKIQSIFALHENTFLLVSLAGVILAVILAARNATSSCAITGEA